MKSWNVILGVDVSKRTLDISCAERMLLLQINNNDEGVGKSQRWCKTNGIDLKKTFVAIKYTED